MGISTRPYQIVNSLFVRFQWLLRDAFSAWLFRIGEESSKRELKDTPSSLRSGHSRLREAANINSRGRGSR